MVEQLSDSPVQIFELHRIGHATESLEAFTHRAHIGQVHLNLDRCAEAGIAAELQQQAVTLHPTPPGVTHLDPHLVVVDAVGGGLLALLRRGDADVTDHFNDQLVANRR